MVLKQNVRDSLLLALRNRGYYFGITVVILVSALGMNLLIIAILFLNSMYLPALVMIFFLLLPGWYLFWVSKRHSSSSSKWMNMIGLGMLRDIVHLHKWSLGFFWSRLLIECSLHNVPAAVIQMVLVWVEWNERKYTIFKGGARMLLIASCTLSVLSVGVAAAESTRVSWEKDRMPVGIWMLVLSLFSLDFFTRVGIFFLAFCINEWVGILTFSVLFFLEGILMWLFKSDRMWTLTLLLSHYHWRLYGWRSKIEFGCRIFANITVSALVYVFAKRNLLFWLAAYLICICIVIFIYIALNSLMHHQWKYENPFIVAKRLSENQMITLRNDLSPTGTETTHTHTMKTQAWSSDEGLLADAKVEDFSMTDHYPTENVDESSVNPSTQRRIFQRYYSSSRGKLPKGRESETSEFMPPLGDAYREHIRNGGTVTSLWSAKGRESWSNKRTSHPNAKEREGSSNIKRSSLLGAKERDSSFNARKSFLLKDLTLVSLGPFLTESSASDIVNETTPAERASLQINSPIRLRSFLNMSSPEVKPIRFLRHSELPSTSNWSKARRVKNSSLTSSYHTKGASSIATTYDDFFVSQNKISLGGIDEQMDLQSMASLGTFQTAFFSDIRRSPELIDEENVTTWRRAKIVAIAIEAYRAYFKEIDFLVMTASEDHICDICLVEIPVGDQVYWAKALSCLTHRKGISVCSLCFTKNTKGCKVETYTCTTCKNKSTVRAELLVRESWRRRFCADCNKKKNPCFNVGPTEFEFWLIREKETESRGYVQDLPVLDDDDCRILMSYYFIQVHAVGVRRSIEFSVSDCKKAEREQSKALNAPKTTRRSASLEIVNVRKRKRLSSVGSHRSLGVVDNRHGTRYEGEIFRNRLRNPVNVSLKSVSVGSDSLYVIRSPRDIGSDETMSFTSVEKVQYGIRDDPEKSRSILKWPTPSIIVINEDSETTCHSNHFSVSEK